VKVLRDIEAVWGSLRGARVIRPAVEDSERRRIADRDSSRPDCEGVSMVAQISYVMRDKTAMDEWRLIKQGDNKKDRDEVDAIEGWTAQDIDRLIFPGKKKVATTQPVRLKVDLLART
jgi:hypothetical protein